MTHTTPSNVATIATGSQITATHENVVDVEIPYIESTTSDVTETHEVDVDVESEAATTATDVSKAKSFDLEHALPLNPDSFPNQPRKGSSVILPTIANAKHLLKMYGIIVRYNVICKKLNITLPGVSGTI